MNKAAIENGQAGIARHLIESDHLINISEAFRPEYISGEGLEKNCE